MRLHHAAGRRRDAEIAILGVGAQALVEIFLAVMADGESCASAALWRASLLSQRGARFCLSARRLAPRWTFLRALAIGLPPRCFLLRIGSRWLKPWKSRKPAIRIFVDADACPVKPEVYRVAERYGLKVYVVANAFMAVPRSDLIERVIVPRRPRCRRRLDRRACRRKRHRHHRRHSAGRPLRAQWARR